MPTLVRLLTILALVAGFVLAVMAALVTFVEPTRRETIVDVPLPRFEPAPEVEAAPEAVAPVEDAPASPPAPQ
ncbi:hypothetical protein [Aurantimonas sp. Leaf443]|uniref:hypothetical protein n=1 Tax=Aurantimonas sp. Leaf443 TaxID=1736378 RepID=UPI0006F9C05F|nr:hypothetical protein [Aurantimonas sp. Leaf443]KQT85868.1 hypothetical protein ASG48_04455 [Aurantimonas sp. Leaf443]